MFAERHSETNLGQATDELIGVSFDASLLHQFFFDLRTGIFPLSANESKSNVIVDGVVEEAWLLLNQADLRPPPLEVDLS